MEEYTASMVQQLTQGVVQSSLEDLLREGARKMLQAALEMEVGEYIERSRESSEALGRQAVVRNGSHAIGDGNLGFWGALREECPSTLEQRCWVHKTANILDKLPKTLQPDAKGLLQQLYLSATKEAALKAYDRFIHRYEPKYPAACECLAKDQEVLFTFYDFPAEHWRHIRTTNPIESTFSTVRHRTRQTKGCGSRLATLTMAFKLTREAEKRWQRLHGYRRLDQLIAGAVFVDGELKNAA